MSRPIRGERWSALQTTFSAGALILSAHASSGRVPEGVAGGEKWSPSVYLTIGPTGTVIIVAHR